MCECGGELVGVTHAHAYRVHMCQRGGPGAFLLLAILSPWYRASDWTVAHWFAKASCQQALGTCLTVHQAKVVGTLRHTWFVNVVLEIQIQGLTQQGSYLLSLSTAPETWASIAPDAGLELKILLPLC